MVREPKVNSDEARTAILSMIATALGSTRTSVAPEAERIFPASDIADVTTRFCDELAAVAGETQCIASRDELPAAIARLVDERGYQTVAVQDADAAKFAASRLGAERRMLASQATKEQIEAAACSIVEGIALLADTGSCIIRARTYGDRLLPYLPADCIAIADAENIFDHMEDAQAALFDAARGGERGEVVIVTGPSRTADIEKTIVLGAHGPRSLTVFIVGPQL